MKTLVDLSYLRVTAALSALLVCGCHKAVEVKPIQPPPSERVAARRGVIQEVTVDEAAQLLNGQGAVAVDANSAQTREAEGVINGAVLLSHYQRFDSSAELPAAKGQLLLFYCCSSVCNAAFRAAERAAAAGYTHVHVMRAGIRAWKVAGHPTVTRSASP
jgi:rhodanese-related sulfurtransferase